MTHTALGNGNRTIEYSRRAVVSGMGTSKFHREAHGVARENLGQGDHKSQLSLIRVSKALWFCE